MSQIREISEGCFDPSAGGVVVASLPYATLVVCAVYTYIASQYQVALMFYLLPIIMVPWLIYLACVTIRRPVLIGLQIWKISIWIAGVSIAATIQINRFESAQRDGRRVSSAIEAYMAKEGSCPEHLEELGIETTPARENYRLAHFTCYDGEPKLWYFSTFTAYDMEDYDFKTHRWNHLDVDLP